MCIVDLRAKVAQDDDSRLVRSIEQRANKKLKVFHALLVAGEQRKEQIRIKVTKSKRHAYHSRWIIDVELQYHEVGVIGYVMRTTEPKVPGIRSTHGSIGELGSGMWKYAQPPLEETGGVT